MSTHDVPGAVATHNDVLAMGCWAEHDDGSLILVEGVEIGAVIYSIFDLAAVPVVEYRSSMPEDGFKDQFSYQNDNDILWTWHDKTPFPWVRIMDVFPAGQKHVSAVTQISAAQRVAQSLDLRAQKVRETMEISPQPQEAATGIMTRIKNAVGALRK